MKHELLFGENQKIMITIFYKIINNGDIYVLMKIIKFIYVSI